MATVSWDPERVRACMARQRWTERELVKQKRIAYYYVNRLLVYAAAGVTHHRGASVGGCEWQTALRIVPDTAQQNVHVGT